MLLDRDCAAIFPEKLRTGELSDYWYLPDIVIFVNSVFFF